MILGDLKMTDYEARLKRIADKRKALNEKIARLKSEQSEVNRKANNHIKLAIGSALLAFMEQENTKQEFKTFVLKLSDRAVQKEGAGREKFEELKKRHGV